MLTPDPDNMAGGPSPRHDQAKTRRDAASTIAHNRKPQITTNNGEIAAYGPEYPTNFHKGLPHDVFGRPDPKAFAAFVAALNGAGYQGADYAKFDVPIGPLHGPAAWDDGVPPATNRSPKPGPGVPAEDAFDAVEHFFSEMLDTSKPPYCIRPPKVRNWESPLGGHQYDLMGPDAGDLAMVAAPKVGKSELTAELAEVYAMALLRDVSFEQMQDPSTPVYAAALSGSTALTVGDIVAQLAALDWFNPAATPKYYLIADDTPTLHEKRRRAARFHEALPHGSTDGQLSIKTLFRGSVPGAKVGPYISQFLLIGTQSKISTDGDGSVGLQGSSKDARNIAPVASPYGNESNLAGLPEEGYIVFGAQRIGQRVNAHRPNRDYMTDWPLWLDVQNGANVRGNDLYIRDGVPRFIGTPRDLATFVHFDELYQAYFNACLLLFANDVPFDYGFPSGRAHATRGSFATFGGPHILSLLTEVASRALKVVRRQKFQHHLRGRPEQLAAMLTLQANNHGDQLGMAQSAFDATLTELHAAAPDILSAIAAVNCYQNTTHADAFPRRISPPDPSAASEVHPPCEEHDGGTHWAHALELDDDKNYLLPMAFPEGSPMHPSYGAGHATVAGACVTILKAFFELSSMRLDDSQGIGRPLTEADAKADEWWIPVSFKDVFKYTHAFVADDQAVPAAAAGDPNPVGRDALKQSTFPTDQLTVEGELNKLAANISIGRNMAGVHFYTDYYDSLRMGERLAVGLLQEQMTTYRDPVTMRLRSFDNDCILISGNGQGGTSVRVKVKVDGSTTWENAYDEGGWWNKHAAVQQATMAEEVIGA